MCKFTIRIPRLRALTAIGILAILVMRSGMPVSHAQDASATNRVSVQLMEPQQPNAPKRKDPGAVKSITISGPVTIEIGRVPTASEVVKKRYLVEYFLDEVLIYQTNGSVDPATGKPTLGCQWNTTAYPPGKHKLVVNFWDDDGPSAIGIQHVIIKNP